MTTNNKTDWALLLLVIPLVFWQILLAYFSYSLIEDFIEFSPNSKFIGIAEYFYFGMIVLFVITALFGYFIVQSKLQRKIKFMLLAGVLITTVCAHASAVYIGYGPIFELENS